MEGLFNSITAWWQLLFIILIPLGVVVGVLALIVFSRKVTVEKEGNVFRLKSGETVHAIPHEYISPAARDLALINKMTTETKDKEDRIRFRNKKEEQMTFALQVMFNLRRSLENIYFDLASEKLDDRETVTAQGDYYFAQLLLDKIGNDMERILELSFQENHFDRLSEIEYERFIKSKARYIAGNALNTFNSMYKGIRLVPRAELFDTIREQMRREFNEAITDIYNRALKISLEKEENILELQRDYSNFLTQFISASEISSLAIGNLGCVDDDE